MPRLIIFNTEEIKVFDKPPKYLSAQKESFFMLDPKLLKLITPMRTPTNKLCTVLHWGYFRSTGRFFSVKDFRPSDIQYVANLLGIENTEINIQKYQKQRKTSREHEKLILKSLGFARITTEIKTQIKHTIARLISQQMQPQEIIYYIASQLHQMKIEIPSYYTFHELITNEYNVFESKLLDTVKDNITHQQKRTLEKVIIPDQQNNDLTDVTRWKIIEQSIKPNKIKGSITIFEEIKITFLQILPLLNSLNLTPQALEYFATWVKKAKSSQLKQFKNKKKLYLYLAAFIQHHFYLRQDCLVDTFLKCVQANRNNVNAEIKSRQKELQAEQISLVQDIANDQERLETLLTKITLVVNDDAIDAEDKIEKIKELLSKNNKTSSQDTTVQPESNRKRLEQLLNKNEKYEVIENESKKLQLRVSEIIKILDFDSDNSCKKIIAAINFFKNVNGDITNNAPLDFLSEKEHIVVKPNDVINPSLYKSLLFYEIADKIKSGDLNLKYSYQYKAFQDYLIDKKDWGLNRSQLLQEAGLTQFSSSHEVLNSLELLINEKYHAVNTRILNNENPNFYPQKNAKYILRTPSIEKDKANSIRSLMPEVSTIPAMAVLNEIARITKFTETFKHMSVKHHKLKPDLKTIIAAIMAQGHNIGVHQIANMSVGLNGNTLQQFSSWFLSTKNIDAANNMIIAMISKLALSKAFKSNVNETHTSSDGMKVGVSVDSLLANYSFKYFGKDKGVSIYTFLDDRETLLYSTVISASEREAIYVMDGLLHNNRIQSSFHSTDTHGFTESVFAAINFIGTSFAPRFKNLSKQMLYSFETKRSYQKKGYHVLPSRKINSKLLHKYWDDILRFMVTIKLKKTSASQLFKRLSSYAKDNPLYKAIKEYGRIIKTQFILTYIDDLHLRQRIEKQLSRVELSNRFSRAVFFEKNQEFQYGTKEEQEIASGCKVLIQNSIILWNYLYLSQLLTARKSRDRTEILKIIKAGSMITWQHVNMRGEYDFNRLLAVNDSSFEMDKILALKLQFAA